MYLFSDNWEKGIEKILGIRDSSLTTTRDIFQQSVRSMQFSIKLVELDSRGNKKRELELLVVSF